MQGGRTSALRRYVTMNWLAENVVGRVPDLEELNDEARERMQLQGIRVDESVQTEK